MVDAKRVWTVADLPPGDVVSIQGKRFPLVGGKLRVLREHFPNASVTTEQAISDPDLVVYRARVVAGEREATATGTASLQGDRALSDSLHELAETRAVARALRFFGVGIDSTGAEEVMGRAPRVADRVADEPPPVQAGEKPTSAQIAELRSLVANLKRAGKKVPEHAIPETQEDAASLIMTLTMALKGA